MNKFSDKFILIFFISSLFIIISVLILNLTGIISMVSIKKSSPVPVMQEDIKISKPVGIYAVVPVDSPSDYDKNQVQNILENEAVSGITLRERWNNLEPQEGKYDFSRIDDLVYQAGKINKTTQLILVPGFFTPDWVLEKIESCDNYLNKLKQTKVKNKISCGKVSFKIPYGPESKKEKNQSELPLPWNDIYKEKWQEFLIHVSQKYNSNSNIVSVAVTGPNSVSAEMSMPEAEDSAKWDRILSLFFPDGDIHRNSNLAIVEEWKKSIDFFNQTFNNKTVVITEGSGLIKFKNDDPSQAKKDIVDYLKNSQFNNNLKGIQTSGMKACRNFVGGIGQVKELSNNGVIAGAQFNSSVSRNPSKMGCTDKDFCSRDEKKDLCSGSINNHPCCAMTASEAMENVLKVYFENTQEGDKFGTAKGNYKMSYLQIYDRDVIEANTNSELQNILRKVDYSLKRMTE